MTQPEAFTFHQALAEYLRDFHAGLARCEEAGTSPLGRGSFWSRGDGWCGLSMQRSVGGSSWLRTPPFASHSQWPFWYWSSGRVGEPCGESELAPPERPGLLRGVPPRL